MILGEAWGREEEMTRRPFVGESGKELFRMLGQATKVAGELHEHICRQEMKFGSAWIKSREQWLEEAGIIMTNVLALRPKDNKIENVGCRKLDLPNKGKGYFMPAIETHPKAIYLRPEYLVELDRLEEEILSVNPNIIVAAGAKACWALLQVTNIGAIRGACTQAIGPGAAKGRKVLPTFHPANILRQWNNRVIVVADLMKAWRESASGELKRPARQILHHPTLTELRQWVQATLAKPPRWLSVDIETKSGQILMVGVARARDDSIIFPFRLENWANYWASQQEEVEAWALLESLLLSGLPILGQNFIYDMQYLTPIGIRMRNVLEDTMLLHHATYPEMPKGLGFLGSIYTDEPAWKLMRRKRADTEKRDE